jgi:formate/nitrite transporter FocA (FNT family)
MHPLLISILGSFSIAVTLVEKGKEYPVKWVVDLLRRALKRIHAPSEKVMDCAVCLSFWVELMIYPLIRDWPNVFVWLVSAFIALGFTWIVYTTFAIFDLLANPPFE